VRQRFDLYTPASAPPAGGWPVVVFFYGGSWNSGERADYRFVGEALAARGVLALVADYRLYPEVRYPEFLLDCAAALGHGLEHAAQRGGNPARVFVMGHSAGGYNAAMLALDARWLGTVGHTPNELAGWIGLAGPYEFLPLAPGPAQPVFFHPNYPAGTQPIEYVGAASPPAFIAAPVNDTVVNPQRSTRAMAARLQAVDARVTLKMYDGVSHTSLIGAFAFPVRFLAPVLDDVVAFVEATRPVDVPNSRKLSSQRTNRASTPPVSSSSSSALPSMRQRAVACSACAKPLSSSADPLPAQAIRVMPMPGPNVSFAPSTV
jgi:acetyl esterase/lipase